MRTIFLGVDYPRKGTATDWNRAARMNNRNRAALAVTWFGCEQSRAECLSAVCANAKIETLISHPVIPKDRRIVYGLESLAGVRPGEASALRWRHYDATVEPLGKLTVAHAYNK